MDDFVEQVAVRKKQGLYLMFYVLLLLLMIVCVLWALLGALGMFSSSESGALVVNWLSVACFLGFGGAAALIWFKKDLLRTEYDYSFTNGTLDVSRVLNNRRRRYLTSLDLKTVTRCGPAKGPSYRKALLEPNVKKHAWYVNRDENLTYFCFERKGAKHLILLELNDALLQCIRGRNYLQRGVWYDAEGKSSAYGSLS